MYANKTPRVVSVERIDGGLVIDFDDGRSALFPAMVSYSALPQATGIKNHPDHGKAAM
jgi:hypothetical protein